MTDEDLYFEVNKRVKKIDPMLTVSYDTFRAYKVEVNTKKYEELEPRLQKFLTLYATAIFIQKKKLFRKMQWDEKGWQRYAWIIERKFSDWNLKHISEETKNINVKVFSLSHIADEAERRKAIEHGTPGSDAEAHEEDKEISPSNIIGDSENL